MRHTHAHDWETMVGVYHQTMWQNELGPDSENRTEARSAEHFLDGQQRHVSGPPPTTHSSRCARASETSAVQASEKSPAARAFACGRRPLARHFEYHTTLHLGWVERTLLGTRSATSVEFGGWPEVRADAAGRRSMLVRMRNVTWHDSLEILELASYTEQTVRLLPRKPCRTRVGDKEWHKGHRAPTQDPSTNDR